MKLNNLHPIEHASFSGTFRLTGRVACFDDDGIPYLRLRLSSCANDYIALAVIDSLVIPEKLGHMELVTVKGQQIHSDKLFATPNDAYKSGIDQVKNQRADLERRAADIDARCVNLETIRAGLRV